MPKSNRNRFVWCGAALAVVVAGLGVYAFKRQHAEAGDAPAGHDILAESAAATGKTRSHQRSGSAPASVSANSIKSLPVRPVTKAIGA